MSGTSRHKRDRWTQATIILLLISLMAAAGVSGATPIASGRGAELSAPPESLTVDEWAAVQALLGDSPFGHEQTHKLVADTPADDDHFGYSVAASGDFVVVGADGADNNTGMFSVFARNMYGTDTWALQQQRTADDSAAGDHFGYAIAFSVDTVVVGAYGHDNETGAAYIFERNWDWVHGWNQVAKLTAGDGADGDRFGYSVGISGDTVIVGAYGDGDAAGSAYTFARNQGGADAWGQVKKLTASDPAAGDWFGWSVAISGDTTVVGARSHEDPGGSQTGAVYIFERNWQGIADDWRQVRRLAASVPEDSAYFGQSVSISVDTVVVGAESEDGDGAGASNRGAAHVFERNQDGADMWGHVAKLTASDAQNSDYFGHSVSIDGENIVVGAQGEDGESSDTAANRGAAYVFARNQGGSDSWGEVSKLSAGDPADKDSFGISVAISGHHVLTGAYQEDGVSTDPDADRGAAYLFVDEDGFWQEVASLHASEPEDLAFFGLSVAVSGDTAVVGAYNENAGGTDRGAAYVFTRNQGGADRWEQVARLTSNFPENGARFGKSVSVSGDTVVVGAYRENGTGTNQGAAYIFERNYAGPDSWGLVMILTASVPVDSSYFGTSVSISGDTVVVGANEDNGPVNRCGSAYVFERNHPSTAEVWGQVAKLNAGDDADSWDNFGYSVAISGDTIVVGASKEDGDGSLRGAAYVFYRNLGGLDGWDQKATLTADDAQDNDEFGNSVAISGDTVVVGASKEDGDGDRRGAAYVFERNQGGVPGDKWGQVQKLIASDAQNEDYFGQAVSISGETVLVGANEADGGGSDRGVAYIYTRNQGGWDLWGEVSKLIASDGADDDKFAWSAGISADTLILGASLVDDGGDARGAAYIFRWQLAHIYLPLVTRGS